MDFPDLGFDNNTNQNDGQINNQDDNIQVEQVEFAQNQSAHNASNSNFDFPGSSQGFVMGQNNPDGNFSAWGAALDNQESSLVDEEEEKRIKARKQEEDERRAKIIQLMNDEIRIKQENRDNARNFIDNFNETRAKNHQKRQEYNRSNEAEFLENRQQVKEGKKNPWEKVVENIEIKESDYKGTKDVSRMRNVILVRKGDMMKMK